MLPRNKRDTIAAVATAPGRAGVGVVRVSGANLLELAGALCDRLPTPRQALLTTWRDAAGQAIDNGVTLFFPAPQSFTGEDVLELQGHGGPVVMQLLLRRCLELGARLAEPGEFTRRAYLNDKLDLAQAEAVADLIDAASEEAARSAMRSLRGEFSRQVHELGDALSELRLRLEGALDFPEEETGVLADVPPRLLNLQTRLAALFTRARQGSVLRGGLTAVLAGRPNVGKSSLLNRLAGEERAIVTDIPGTTRDILRETVLIEGVPLHVIDTAGLRETAEVVEQAGIERAWREIENADVVLRMVDARSPQEDADDAIDQRLPPRAQRLLIANKSDLADLPPGRALLAGGQVRLTLSAKTGEGVDLLHYELLRIAGWQAHGEDAILARERHLQALSSASAHLDAACGKLDQIELCAEELRLVQEELAQITGEFTADDLLGMIFSRFCIGK